MKTFKLEVSIEKTKVMTFCSSDIVRAEIVLNDHPLELDGLKQPSITFKYLGYELGLHKYIDIERKLALFQRFCRTIRYSLFNRARKETLIKFYKIIVAPMLLCGSECSVLTNSNKGFSQLKFLCLIRKVSNQEIRSGIKLLII